MFEREANLSAFEAAVLEWDLELQHQQVWRELAEEQDQVNRDSLESANHCIELAAAKGIDRLCYQCGHPLSKHINQCPRCHAAVCIGCGE